MVVTHGVVRLVGFRAEASKKYMHQQEEIDSAMAQKLSSKKSAKHKPAVDIKNGSGRDWIDWEKRDTYCIFGDGIAVEAEYIPFRDVTQTVECPITHDILNYWTQHGEIKVLLAEIPKTSDAEHAEQSPKAKLLLRAHIKEADTRIELAGAKKIALCTSSLGDYIARYLPEWIEYNRMMGVEHFVLYVARTDSIIPSLLEPYIRHGIASIVHGNITGFYDPNRSFQTLLQNDCLYRVSDQFEWVLYTDPDEFPFPLTPGITYIDLLNKHRHAMTGGVSMLSMFFMDPVKSREFLAMPSTPSNEHPYVLEQFVQRSANFVRRGREKTFHKTRNTEMVDVHTMHVAKGVPAAVPPDEWLVNHYYDAQKDRRAKASSELPFDVVYDSSIWTRYGTYIVERVEAFWNGSIIL